LVHSLSAYSACLSFLDDVVRQVGACNVEASAGFYDAALSPLHYVNELSEGYYCFSIPDTVDKSNGPGSIPIARPLFLEKQSE
jgi:hypothetical protein